MINSYINNSYARIAEQREQLEEMLARDRERYAREDTEISNKMREQGIRWVHTACSWEVTEKNREDGWMGRRGGGWVDGWK